MKDQYVRYSQSNNFIVSCTLFLGLGIGEIVLPDDAVPLGRAIWETFLVMFLPKDLYWKNQGEISCMIDEKLSQAIEEIS